MKKIFMDRVRSDERQEEGDEDRCVLELHEMGVLRPPNQLWKKKTGGHDHKTEIVTTDPFSVDIGDDPTLADDDEHYDPIKHGWELYTPLPPSPKRTLQQQGGRALTTRRRGIKAWFPPTPSAKHQ